MFDVIAGYIITGLTTLGTVIGVIISILQTVKARKEGNVAEKAQNTIDILTTINKFIVEAEKFVNADGQLKKEIVTAKVLDFARKQNINVEEETISTMIDEAVELTKKVNKRPKDVAQETTRNDIITEVK
ncbi:MAG: phage holin, LLH family [Oscillospiraceae bacterium]